MLRHIGHLSLASHEKALTAAAKDKADIFLLRKWAKFIADDPYFTEPMRRYLYKDSPEPFRLHAPEHQPGNGRKGDILVISHDLTRSGAPIMLLEACRTYVNNGYFVCLVSRQDGPLRKDFLEAGIPVMIDSLALEEHPSLTRFARNFDCVIANTIIAWPAVRLLQDLVPTIWWLHEGALLDSFMNRPDCAATLRLAKRVIGVSQYSIAYIKRYNPAPRLIRLGCIDWRKNRTPPPKTDAKKTIFSIVASIEPRKGQDILVKALSYLPVQARQNLEIWLIGRSLDRSFAAELAATIQEPGIIQFLGEKSRDECLNLMDQSDVILCPSRDDPFPVVTMEAFSLSKPCILSTSTGTCELVRDKENGLVFASEDAGDLARAITWTLENTALLPRIGAAARATFEEHLTLRQYQQAMLSMLEEDNRFITSDEFSDDDHLCHRQQMARTYLKGTGIEIGALHKPLAVDPKKASVLYVDYKNREENMARYPELVAAGETIVNTDIIDDGFFLKSVSDSSLDFVIANHALEHSPDPLGTLDIWSHKLRPSGILYVTIPIADRCYDKGRPITSLQHFREDHRHFTGLDKGKLLTGVKEHIREFISVSGRNIAAMNKQHITAAREQELFLQLSGSLEDGIRKAGSYEELVNAHVMRLNRVYDIHYHTFSPSSYEAFLRDFCTWKNLRLEAVLKNGSGECIGIIRNN